LQFLFDDGRLLMVPLDDGENILADFLDGLVDGPLSIDWTHGIEKITQHNRTFVRIEWV